jgi:hypothetical protein
LIDRSPGSLSYSGTIENKLLFDIDPQELGHEFVIEGPDGTGAATHLLCSKVEVLAGMAGIKVNKPVCPFGIPPGHPVDDS